MNLKNKILDKVIKTKFKAVFFLLTSTYIVIKDQGQKLEKKDKNFFKILKNDFKKKIKLTNNLFTTFIRTLTLNKNLYKKQKN